MYDRTTERLVLDHVRTDDAIVHTLPHPGPYCTPIPEFRIAARASLSTADVPAGATTVITGTLPIEGEELQKARLELAEAVSTMRATATAEGGDGFLLGYDPLSPTARIPSGELEIGADCVFVWSRDRGEGPLFEWGEVAHLATGDGSVHVFLVDGRVVSIHADIDWWNRIG